MRVLVVEDEADLRDVWAEYLGLRGHEVRGAASVAEARQVLAAGFDPNVALVDWTLPDGDGGAVMALLAETRPDCRVLLCTGLGPTLDAAARGHAERVLTKPFTLKQLDAAIAG